MKLARVITILIAFNISLSTTTAAHPLGNFSINQFSRIEVASSKIILHEILDLAEIPTFQASASIDTDQDGTLSDAELAAYGNDIASKYAANLLLNVNGTVLAVIPGSTSVEVGAGAADLATLKVTMEMTAAFTPTPEPATVTFQNNNYAERLGWNEIVLSSADGIKIYNTAAKGSSASAELTNYPQDSLNAALAERKAEFSFVTGAIPPDARPLENRDGHVTAPVQTDRFAQLISIPEITPWAAFFGLLAAFGMGSLHAMSPGHGKTVVGAYLVGSKGTVKHAAFLGLTVTVTHTLGVFALGLITLFASNYILPERLIPILGFMSGALVIYIGATMLKKRILEALRGKAEHSDHDHVDPAHTHAHGDATHSHGGVEHTHLPPEKLSWKNLLALGISGGLLPCPSALVLMLAAISLNRVGYGLILTLVFSLGLAATLTGIGLAFLFFGRIFDRPSLSGNRLIKLLPVFSAFTITCLGVAICYGSFSN